MASILCHDSFTPLTYVLKPKDSEDTDLPGVYGILR